MSFYAFMLKFGHDVQNTMVNSLAKNAYYFATPSSQDPYFFPVFTVPRDTNKESNLWEKCAQR